jgi:N-acetylglutamate synthase-like GNAT family acetyltransferase
MELEAPSFKTNAKLVLETVTEGKLERWATVYLEAFYGDTKIMEVVVRTLGRVSRNKDATLILASRDGKPAGCLALFRSQGVLGVYCVGTVPDMRGEHVASTMLDLASKLAIKENRKLVLQTILSDSVEPLYLKLGFKRLYLKELFTREPARKLKS